MERPALPLHIDQASLDRLCQSVTYNPNSGLFYWKSSGKGRESHGFAGTQDPRGYIKLGFERRMWQAHQVAWYITHGVWPSEIDHINGKTEDNRLVNLRSVTRTENNMNSKVRNDNTSGHKGVTYVKRYNRWQAQINKNGNYYCLGRFKTMDEAIDARQRAEKAMFGDHRRTA